MMEIVLSETCRLSEDQGTLNSCIGLCFTQIVYSYRSLTIVSRDQLISTSLRPESKFKFNG
jgi:hypothetical protein